MTYAFSWPLQQALFAALQADPTVTDLTAGRIYDEAPHADALGGLDGPYVVLGDETVDAWSTATDRGASHAVQVSAISPERGFGALKRLAAAVCDVALGPLPLTRGRVVFASFLGGRTRRIEGAGLRRIDLRFRLAVEDL